MSRNSNLLGLAVDRVKLSIQPDLDMFCLREDSETKLCSGSHRTRGTPPPGWHVSSVVPGTRRAWLEHPSLIRSPDEWPNRLPLNCGPLMNV